MAKSLVTIFQVPNFIEWGSIDNPTVAAVPQITELNNVEWRKQRRRKANIYGIFLLNKYAYSNN